MKVKLSEFNSSKDLVYSLYNEKGLEHVMYVCSVSGIPLIHALKYLEELYPDNVGILHRIKVMEDFYGYTSYE